MSIHPSHYLQSTVFFNHTTDRKVNKTWSILSIKIHICIVSPHGTCDLEAGASSTTGAHVNIYEAIFSSKVNFPYSPTLDLWSNQEESITTKTEGQSLLKINNNQHNLPTPQQSFNPSLNAAKWFSEILLAATTHSVE